MTSVSTVCAGIGDEGVIELMVQEMRKLENTIKTLEQELDNVYEYLVNSPSGMDGFEAWLEEVQDGGS